MATLRLNVSMTDQSVTTLVRDSKPLTVGENKHVAIQRAINLLDQVNSGGQRASSIGISVVENGTKATGTVTLASVQAADTVTINGVVFTAVSGAPAANQFDISGTDTTSAASLALAINSTASALVNQNVTATSALGVVTISSQFYSTGGNINTLASSNGGRLAVSGARLTGGTTDTPATYSY